MTLNLYATTRGVRKTTSGLVSVLDVIRVIKGCSRETACALYHKMVRDQLVPSFPKILFNGKWQHLTPVASGQEIVKLIFALPGKHNFRHECADLYMSYIGGQLELKRGSWNPAPGPGHRKFQAHTRIGPNSATDP